MVGTPKLPSGGGAAAGKKTMQNATTMKGLEESGRADSRPSRGSLKISSSGRAYTT
jgi:hypothetical protein